MSKFRTIPVLLLHKRGLYKTIKFKNPKYIGDPINAVKIFNEKEADEIVLLDIDATNEMREPDYLKLAEITSEAFMPLAYGGGITTLDQISKLFFLGVEKVILNTCAFRNPDLIQQATAKYGSQAIVVCIDYKKNIFGKPFVYVNNGKSNTRIGPSEYAEKMESIGVGEIILNCIDRDGTFKGYDLRMIKEVSNLISIPVVALGGASGNTDFNLASSSGAAAAAAGSLFVYQKATRAVLINYPYHKILNKLFIFLSYGI